MRLHRYLILALLGCAFGPAGPAAAGLIYQVDVNTSSLAGSGGYLDFQLNPGDNTAQPLTALVEQFAQTGGSLAPTSTNTGDAAGTLPAALTLDNGTAFNDVFQQTTFGSHVT